MLQMCFIRPTLDGKPISNFSVELHRLIDIYDGSKNEPSRLIEFSLTLDGKPEVTKKRVPLLRLQNIDWSEQDYRASFLPQIPRAKANRSLASLINDALGNLPLATVYQLQHPGFYKINGMAVFCTGEEAIRPSASGIQESEIECMPMSQRLDFDPAISEEEAVSEVLNLISLFPNPGRVILSQVLVSLLRQAYEDAGRRPSFCVFLHGRTGTQKTTIASFLTQIYNRGKGITAPLRLNASQASTVELLLEVTDQVQIFDDLFPAASGQIRKKQEETLSEITRYIGDGTIPARIRGTTVQTGQPRCGVLFTGEYLIGSGSDAARLLPVEMAKPDTSALSRFQARPLIVSTFYRSFIAWVVNNYDAVVSYLRDWWETYCNTDLNVHDRLRETHFFLNTAYALMLTYCGEKRVLSQEEITQFHGNFLKLLSKLIREQQERVSPNAPALPMQENVLECIKNLYQNHQLSIPKDKHKFTDGEHDGVLHGGCLCLREQALSRFFPSREVKDIIAELDEHGALNKGRTALKKKISDTGGKYFYWIPLSFLKS